MVMSDLDLTKLEYESKVQILAFLSGSFILQSSELKGEVLILNSTKKCTGYIKFKPRDQIPLTFIIR